MERPLTPEAEGSGGNDDATPVDHASLPPPPPPSSTPEGTTGEKETTGTKEGGCEAEAKKADAPPPPSAAAAAPPRVPLCSKGDLLKGKWEVIKQIGMGAFGEIYLGQNIVTDERVAIKVEPINEERQALRTEVAILRKLQECPYVGRFISCGRQEKINYLVMQLLGENLAELRKRQPKSMFTIPTVCRLAIDMVMALQSIHDLGILHRDVKPSNFVLDMPVDSPNYSVRK